MKKVAKFEKVSCEQFKNSVMEFAIEKYGEGLVESVGNDLAEKAVEVIYDKIKLPKRATIGSAGYDFFLPFSIKLKPGETIKIPTGVRVKINEGWVLKAYPRSGLGFKYRLQLNNTVGIIDSDYYNSDNEGHIFAKITNDSNEEKTISLNCGEAFMQGIFVEYGITEDDDADGVRNGGFGSTSSMRTQKNFLV